MSWIWARRWLVALVVTLGCSSAAFGCPNCKEAVASQAGAGDGSRAAAGYNWSILLMLAVPFSMLGAGTLLVRRAVKQGAFPEL